MYYKEIICSSFVVQRFDGFKIRLAERSGKLITLFYSRDLYKSVIPYTESLGSFNKSDIINGKFFEYGFIDEYNFAKTVKPLYIVLSVEV